MCDENTKVHAEWFHCLDCGNYLSSNTAKDHVCDKKQLKEKEEYDARTTE